MRKRCAAVAELRRIIRPCALAALGLVLSPDYSARAALAAPASSGALATPTSPRALPAHAVAELPAGRLTPARRTGRIVLDLPGGRTVRLIPGSSTVRSDGTTRITASVGEDRLLLTTDGKRLFGHVMAAGRVYVIDTHGDGAVVLDAERIESPMSASGAWRDDTVLDPQLTGALLARSAKAAHAGLQGAGVAGVVDIALFVEAAVELEHGAQAVRTRAQAWADFTNQAFQLNGVPLSLRVAYVGVLDGTLPVGAGADLFGAFQRNAAATAIAGQFGADLRHLIYSQSARPGIDSCGRGTLLGDLAITGYECGERSFAHEIGHNFGAHHDRANVPAGERGAGAYNFGYVCGGRGTIMSYAGAAGLDHYSSPHRRFNGEACGVAVGQPDAAFNAAVIEAHRGEVAGFATPPPASGTVRFAASSVTLEETGPAVEIELIREGDLSLQASVEVGLIDDTATEGEDVQPLLQRVVFAAGEAVRTVTLQPLDDAAFDAPVETLRAVLRYPFRLTVSGEPLLVRIVGSDDPDRGQAAFMASAVSVRENIGSLHVPLLRTGAASEALSVSVAAIDETARAGIDYRLAAGQVTFAPGEREKSIEVAILDDELYQGYQAYRYFTLRLSGVNLGTTREQRVFVVNDDLRRGRAQLAAAGVSVRHGSASVAVEVERIEGAEGDLRFHYATVDGSARAGGDYVAREGEITLANGALRTTLAVPLVAGAPLSSGRTFEVRISGEAIGPRDVSVVTITATPAEVAGPDGGGGSLSLLMLLALLTARTRKGDSRKGDSPLFDSEKGQKKGTVPF